MILLVGCDLFTRDVAALSILSMLRFEKCLDVIVGAWWFKNGFKMMCLQQSRVEVGTTATISR